MENNLTATMNNHILYGWIRSMTHNVHSLCMDNNLTATVIIYYMDGSDQWHWELYTSLMTFKTFSTIQWSSIYD